MTAALATCVPSSSDLTATSYLPVFLHVIFYFFFFAEPGEPQWRQVAEWAPGKGGGLDRPRDARSRCLYLPGFSLQFYSLCVPTINPTRWAETAYVQ